MKTINFTILLLLFTAIFHIPLVLADSDGSASGALSEAFGALFGESAVQKIFSWEITMPMDFGKDDTFPGLFVLLVLVALTGLIYIILRKTVPLFKDGHGSPKTKNTAIIISLAVAGITVLTSPFLYYIISLIDLITVYGFSILIILIFWMGIRYFLKGIRKVNQSTAKTLDEMQEDTNKKVEGYSLKKTEEQAQQGFQDWRADMQAQEDIRENVHRGLDQLRNFSRKESKNAKDIVKFIDDLINHLPDPSMLTSDQQKAALSQVAEKMKSLLTKLQQSWTDLTKIEEVTQQVENIISSSSKASGKGSTKHVYNRFESFIRSVNKEIVDVEAALGASGNSDSDIKFFKKKHAELEGIKTDAEAELQMLQNYNKDMIDIQNKLNHFASSDAELRNKISAGMTKIQQSFAAFNIPEVIEGLKQVKEAEIERQEIEKWVKEINRIDDQVQNISKMSNKNIKDLTFRLNKVLDKP